MSKKLTNKQILQKAIEKAQKNGYDDSMYQRGMPLMEMFIVNHPEIFIFSHDFAKAFWGEEWKDGDVLSLPMSEAFSAAKLDNIKVWQCHLKNMVLAKEPLKYIEKFL